MMYLNLVVFLN
uniref:Uncharacterized protein n=1 Tax=Rhizophora mucronata TaxID=61149 RepID=A0A2P2NKD1_RHIMU